MQPTIRESIQNALDFIESVHHHKNGAVYEDLAQALADLEFDAELFLDQELSR